MKKLHIAAFAAVAALWITTWYRPIFPSPFPKQEVYDSEIQHTVYDVKSNIHIDVNGNGKKEPYEYFVQVRTVLPRDAKDPSQGYRLSTMSYATQDLIPGTLDTLERSLPGDMFSFLMAAKQSTVASAAGSLDDHVRTQIGYKDLNEVNKDFVRWHRRNLDAFP